MVKLTLPTRPFLLNYKQPTTTSPPYARPRHPPIVVRHLNALGQIYLPRPYRVKYAVIGIRAVCALNYYALINISIKYIEEITSRKTIKGLRNNLYPLSVSPKCTCMRQEKFYQHFCSIWQHLAAYCGQMRISRISTCSVWYRLSCGILPHLTTQYS